MKKSGEIKIYSEHNEGSINIFIEDSGIGIPDDIISQVYEPFISTKEKGTGLGLSIAREIMINHQGEIEIVKTGRKGTTVKISFKSSFSAAEEQNDGKQDREKT